MMNTFKKLAFTFAYATLSLTLPFAAVAADPGDTGDIYRIFRCDKFGNELDPAKEPTLEANGEARFLVRLAARKRDTFDTRFYPVYQGGGSLELANVFNSLTIGIYVNGVLDVATLENYYVWPEDGKDLFTDFVFVYKVKAGDFAKPIRLADKDGGMITPESNSSEYYLPNVGGAFSLWRIASYADKEKTMFADDAKFVYCSNQRCDDVGLAPIRPVDYDLSGCGFDIETVEFGTPWSVEPTGPGTGCWRTIHEGSGKVGDGEFSSVLHVKAPPQCSSTLYVWAKDESAVRIRSVSEGGKGVQLPIQVEKGKDPVARYVQAITLNGEQDYEITLWGVSQTGGAAKDGQTELVLTAFKDGFNFDPYNLVETDPLPDFVAVPVKCGKPLDAGVSVRANKTSVSVGPDYQTAAFDLVVEVSAVTAFDKGECSVVLTPEVIPSVDATLPVRPWKDYVFVSEGEYDEVASRTGDPVTLKFSANGSKTVHVYALGADAVTAAAGGGIRFSVKEAPGGSYLKSDGFCKVGLKPTVPVLTLDGEDVFDTTTSEPVTFNLKVDDCHMNCVDTNGFVIYYRDKLGAAWEELEKGAKWLPDADGWLWKVKADGSKAQPSRKYTIVGTYNTQFMIKGGNASSSQATPISVTVNVSKGKGAYAQVSRDGKTWVDSTPFAEGESLNVKVTLSQPATSKLYAFLAPADDDTAACVDLDSSVFTNSTKKPVMVIDPERGGLESAPTTVSFKIKDGTAGAGTALNFKVLLSKSEQYDADKEDKTYNPTDLLLYSTNVPPRVAAVYMGATKELRTAKALQSEEFLYWGNGAYKTTAVVSPGMTEVFSIDVPLSNQGEPSSVDLEATNATDWVEGSGVADRRFRVDWSLTENGSRNPKSGTYRGNPSDFCFTNKFSKTGVAVGEITVYDKDMSANEPVQSFIFYVNVDKKPQVVMDRTELSATEGASPAPSLTISLSDGVVPEVEGGLKFKVSVTNNDTTVTDPLKLGYMKFSQTTLKPWKDESGAVVPNVFEGTLGSDGKLKLIVDDFDGTQITADKGFSLHVEVATTNVNEDTDLPWNECYIPLDTTFYFVNKAPTLTCSLGNDNTVNTNRFTVGIGDAINIKYRIDDIDVDVTNGVYVQWWDTDNGDSTQVTVTNREEVSFSTHFKESGYKSISVYVWDKDMTKPSTPLHTWDYEVNTAKILYTLSTGPGQGMANSEISAAFAGAKGVGAGHTWADATFSRAQKFKIGWNCGLKTSVDAYGWGYKAPTNNVQRLDDGWLDSPTRFAFDVPLLPDGGNESDNGKSELTGGYYDYVSPYDSFLFGWVSHTTGDGKGGGGSGGGSGLTSTFMGLAPEKWGRGATAAPVPLPAQAAGGGNTATTQPSANTVYPDTYYEAIFSRELLESDNLGDINGDGIPDAYLVKGVYDKLLQGGTGGSGDNGYEVYLKDLNETDEGEPYCVEGDYLPYTERSVYGSLIPGLKDGWAKTENAFIPRVKIRGYDEDDLLARAKRGTYVSALNDAPVQAGVLVDKSNDILPDRVYTNPREDEKSTLNYVEWLAWSEFKAQYEVDHPGETAPVTAWSPERPTDPTKKDTDGDGFTDGYEYYFWYLAHVGWVDVSGNHKRLSGRRYNPRNPGEGDYISPDDVAAAMDPLTPTGYKLRDTDNDGLPDLLEFEIGTNPVDFDSDGDGLPDGWEIMIAGLDPTTPCSCADAILDTERNYDGDAMAISSYQLEQVQTPVPVNYEHAKRWTFAVLRDKGDTDGVQWYATVDDPSSFLEEGTAVENWYLTSVGGVDYCFETKPAVVDGRLAADTMAYTIAGFTPPPSEEDDDEEDEEDEEELVLSPLMGAEDGEPARGYPVLLPGGTVLDGDPEEQAEPLKVWKIKDGGIEADKANACWIYGKGTANARLGELAASAAEYGCLALARNLAVDAGAIVTAFPQDDRDVAFLHYLCYQEFGFDPRTAWNANSPLAPRWGKGVGGDTMTGVEKPGQGGYTGAPSRTREYTAYDEFLVCSFFWNNLTDGVKGDSIGFVTYVVDKDAPDWAKTWAALTTNPQGPGEPELLNGENYYGRNSDQGADTDGDGVPDGWELYIMAGPKRVDKDGNAFYVFAPPYDGFKAGPGKNEMPKSLFSPFVDMAAAADTANYLFTGVSNESYPMTELRKYAGTDSCNYYSVPAANRKVAYSTTILRPAEDALWLNKFFPADPWTADTDGDGLTDGQEGQSKAGIHAFIYGTPVDNGGSTSIPGGGLNPLSVDTDRDGLPDGWEHQFRGTKSSLYAGDDANYAEDADGNPVGNPLQGLTDGMDGTVADAFSGPYGCSINGVNQVVDRDYDHDGLDNWQEYLTGTMRCWRYDDPVSPINALTAEVYFDKDGAFKPDFKALGIDTEAEDEGWGEFWYKTLVDSASPLYNPHFITGTSSGAQYFSRVENVWDCAYLDSDLSGGAVSGAYYWFYNRGNGEYLAKSWSKRWQEALGVEGYDSVPSCYASCSPVDPDSDHDGMDDYYELFHGLNPLLGTSGVKGHWWFVEGGGAITGSGIHVKNDGEGFDIVYDSLSSLSGNNPQAWGEGDSSENYKNFWQRLWEKRAESAASEDEDKYEGPLPRGTGYDFVFYPWLTGLATADADGDGTRNQEEAVMPMMAPTTAWHHTDPSALWITDSSYSNSLVRQSYRLPVRTEKIKPDGETFEYDGVTYAFSAFDGFVDGEFIAFNPDSWSVAGTQDNMNWIASFEENEGFDSDHDGLNDQDELSGKYSGKTDPIHADSPMRRQAMYFQGKDKPSLVQTMPFVREKHPDAATFNQYPDDMSFLQYTVECWVKPETLDDATIVERAMWTDQSNPADKEFVRCNFRLAIKGGKWCTKFDPNDTTEKSVEAVSELAATTEWTHLAATYDGTMLRLYVNGVQQGFQQSGLQPAYGSSSVTVDGMAGVHARPGMTYWRDREYKLQAIVLGASFKTCGQGVTDGSAFDVTRGAGLNAYSNFFKGYVDEVRVWDGARAAGEISGERNVRYTAEMAAANRSKFYDEWSKAPAAGLYRGRYALDGSGNPYALPAELRFHWAFDSVFGAGDEKSVAKVPAGFGYQGEDDRHTGARALQTRPDGYEIAWWKNVLDGYGSVYAGETNWVTWIPNTVTHLPRFDGTTLDSRYWSEDFAGAAAGAYRFARTAEPVSFWTQYVRNGIGEGGLAYSTTGSRNFFLLEHNPELCTAFEFTGRHLNQTGDDMLALGGAYVKHIDEMWDGQGSSSNWEISGNDSDGDGLPDWWEDWANDQYRDDAVTKKDEIDWETWVIWPSNKDGTHMRAYEAYLRDLARGYHCDQKGVIVTELTPGSDSDKYRQAYDTDGNGIPDWWQRLYGLKDGEIYADSDNDGLSDYAEYMLSEVFRFRKLRFSPINPYSVDPYTPDYFYKVGELYVGEIFTDHDFMDDNWEDRFNKAYVSRLNYDPDGDADGDGWSNRSEFFAGTDPSKFSHAGLEDSVIADYPQPMIHVEVSLPKDADPSAAIVIQAFSSDDTAVPAATWKTAAGETSFAKEKTVGMNPGGTRRYYLSPGSVSPGKVAVLFNDESAVTYYYNVIDGRRVLTKSVITGSGWYPVVNDRVRPDGGVIGDLVKYTGEIIGWINYTTGEVELWFDASELAWGSYVGETGTAGTGDNAVQTEETTEMDLTRAYIKFMWQASVVKQGTLAEFYLNEADTGFVREGKNTFVAFADADGDGSFTPGEAYGVLAGVDVSWSGTSVKMELTKTSPVTPRLKLWAGSGSEGDEKKGGNKGGSSEGEGIAADRPRTIADIQQEILEAIDAKYPTPAARSNELARTRWMETNVPVDPVLPTAGSVRIRVVRWLVDGMPLWRAGVPESTVLDRYYDVSQEATLTEKDFIGASSFDLDWEKLSTDAAGRRAMTEIDYLIVVGEGATGWKSEDDTNVVVRAFPQVIARKYGATRATPEVVSPSATAGQVVTDTRPTFEWHVNEPDISGYTAFKVQVTDSAGALVYDSGVRALPARNERGNYVWKAPLCVGDKAAGGSDYFNDTRYAWRVSMYNAKFASDAFSTAGNYFLNVETNRFTYGMADIAVKYFGPSKSYTGKTIRVRAFESADFTGDPVAAGYVKLPNDPETGVGVTGKVVKANCRLIGIPEGSYYLQAFIDSNGNGRCDPWESMGYLCGRTEFRKNWQSPVAMTFGKDVGSREQVTIYIEDADTDGDMLPDAYERAGGSDTTGCEKLSILSAGELVADKTLIADLQANVQLVGDIRGGLASRMARLMSTASPEFAALVSGVDPRTLEPVVEVMITELAFNTADQTVEIAFSGDVTSMGEGFNGEIFTYRPGDTLKFQVYHTVDLAREWQPVGDVKTVSVSAGNVGDKLKVDMSDLNVKGGFFMVKVVP